MIIFFPVSALSPSESSDSYGKECGTKKPELLHSGFLRTNKLSL